MCMANDWPTVEHIWNGKDVQPLHCMRMCETVDCTAGSHVECMALPSVLAGQRRILS